MNEVSNRDPHNLKARLEKIADILFTRIESRPDMFETKELLSAIQIVGMWLTRETKLTNDSDTTIAGSAVRKYASAFARPNATGGGKADRGPKLARIDSGSDDGGDAA